MSKVSVIIPNYNGIEFLETCFKSINIQKNIKEVIVVDNGSHDRSIEFIKSNYPQFILIKNKTNLGFAKAINQGIAAASGEYVFLLNNDMELEKNCISNLLKCIENDQTFSASSKMIQYYERNKIDDAGDEYSLLGWTKRVGYGKSQEKYNQKRNIFSACAGASIYKKSILDKIGYFDENFFAYMEDVDIGYRARIHGFQNIYCPEALVYHVGSGTSGSRYNEFKIKLAARNNIYVPYKNMPWPQIILNSPFLVAGYLIKYIFFHKKGQGKTYLAGIKEALSTLKKIDKVEYKNKNIKNYLKIEWLLIKNTIKFLFF
ncbi:MAG: glycosyltransferase family 2 protein [Methanobacteriales archaeon HGW-Methanobacteriales-1]|jgi:GT2 family glycosyltransferase|nr:MAG: glycosyltransferase family 2 protein [Methanobacteriales archaeon HGW-Methanobacteriales-1]